MEKTVIARKEQICSYCGRKIQIGKKHTYGKGREPKFDDDDETQIGIEYFEYRLCDESDQNCRELL